MTDNQDRDANGLGIGLSTGDNSCAIVSLTSAAPAMIVTAQRVVPSQNNLYFSVEPNTSTTETVEVTIGKDYATQTAFVDELNSQITAHTVLQTALKAVSGYIRFSVVAATSTVAEHIRVSCYMANINLLSRGSLDIIRFLGRDFVTAAGAFTLQSSTPWSAASIMSMTFDNPTPLVQMPRSLYIYLPDLIADANVGGYESTLLRCVQMVGDIGSVQTYEPQYIQWHDVTPSGMRLGQIHVVLRNAFGEIVQFEWGSITTTIEFRPIMAAIAGA